MVLSVGWEVGLVALNVGVLALEESASGALGSNFSRLNICLHIDRVNVEQSI